jgi:hemolysin activation/secretion protein
MPQAKPAAHPTSRSAETWLLRLTRSGVAAMLLFGHALLASAPLALAQGPRTGGLERGPEETRPELPEFAPAPAPELELPPLPQPPGRERRPSAGVRVFVREFRTTGNTVISDRELAEVTAPYTGRAITTEELLELRDALTRLYVERGYVNSGAIVPDQEVAGGVVEIRIVEGVLDDIAIAGLGTLRETFVEERIRIGAGPPLNVNDLRERIQLLLDDPAIQQINARLGPGARPGESRLEVDVVETPPYRTDLRISNDRSPSIGAEGAELTFTFGNLFGRSDPLRVQMEASEGLADLSFSYSVPVTPSDLRLFVAGEVSQSDVVDEPFNEIDVESEASSIQLGASLPLIRTLDQELRLEASIERERSTTFLLGRRFSFSPGVQDGRSDVTALRLAQQWQRQATAQVIAVRFTESIGLDVLGATSNPGDLPDGQFLAWLGQVQYVRRLNEADWQLALRGDLQLTSDPLLPIEKIAIGGVDTVRGYRENQLVLDSGWVVSAELRVPLGRLQIPKVALTPDDGLFQIAPFLDAGGGWNRKAQEPDPRTIYSIGAGLRWQLNSRIGARLDFGLPLKDVDEPDDKDLQDYGIHFEISAALY